jgi:hypothetical protein
MDECRQNKLMKLRYLIVLLLILLTFSTLPAIAESNVWDKETELYFKPLNITVYRSPSCIALRKIVRTNI